MSDYDESIDGLVEEEESENDDEYDEYDSNDYDYYHRRRRWDYDYSDRECKRCKTEDSYEFVTINPVILTNVPKLMDMASVTVAATLWNHINVPQAVRSVRDRCTKSSTQWSTLCADVIALIGDLPVPKLIAEQIDPYVRKMTNEITAWVSYHYRTVFLKNGLDKFVYSLVYHIVWYPNGAIDCVQTARSMMTSVRLSDVEKFRFLCVYCLYDDMGEMSPLIYLDNALDYLSCDEDPLIFYWYCYFRNELDKIPGSINVYMLHHDKVDNWPAKEYFFDRLAYDEQAREAISLIDKHGAVYQKPVLLKLDETQRLLVYMERATQVIVNYARPRISSRFILQTWFEARNLIHQDQFLTLFRELLSSGVKDVLLAEIWASASDDSKQHVVCANVHEIVMKVLTKWRWRDNSDFVFVLLQDSNAMIKQSITMQEFFSDYCKKLIENSKFQELDRLLVFCLPDAEDLAQFKSNFVSESNFFNAHCQRLLMKSEFQDLDQLMEFCLPDPENLVQFKVNFINNSNRYIINTHCERLLMSNKFQELGKLLEFCFPDAEDLLQFKINLVNNSRLDVIKTHCEKLLTNGEFQDLDRLLTFCLPDADYLAKFKRNFVYSSEYNFFNDHCEKLLVNGKFQEIDQLLEFCLLGAEDMLQFKMNLMNNSESDVIKTHCERLLKNSEFQQLDRLLTFCLPDADYSAKFKRNFVYSTESNFFNVYCQKLLVNGKFQEIDQLLEFCFFDAEDLLQCKMNLISNAKHNDKIKTHCEKLLTNGEFQELDRLLEFCLPGAENAARFKKNLVKNSKHVRKTCLAFYSSGNLNDLNNYLKQLLTPYPDTVVQYKKKLITSSRGIDMCVGIMDTKFSILDGILEDALKDPISITEFKKTMIFSPAAISKLTDSLLNNRLNAVQTCIDRYLISTDERYALKKQLVGDIMKLIQAILRENDESYLQTVLIWWFGNENAVQEFKRSLHFDSVFIEMLKDCVFLEYHQYISRCKFKYMYASSSSSDFNAFDRFLNWYFQSPVKVKEYKMKVIYSYSKIDVFQTFLRGARGDTQLKTVLQWFFKNDTAEIAKFKKRAGKSKITDLI
ncbi:uncharacterized protein LOC135848908 [Planococcus citri]|uniref:uncharacterized protein LOC135848908 n=1 Tax=Planococcus citri TaxID=170843 RepID=UPI0031F748FB